MSIADAAEFFGRSSFWVRGQIGLDNLDRAKDRTGAEGVTRESVEQEAAWRATARWWQRLGRIAAYLGRNV